MGMRPELKTRWINRYPDAVCEQFDAKKSESSCAIKGPRGKNQGLLNLRCPTKSACPSCRKGGSLITSAGVSHIGTADTMQNPQNQLFRRGGLATAPGWAQRDSRTRYGLRVQRDRTHGGFHGAHCVGRVEAVARSVKLSPRFAGTCPWHRSRPLPLGFSWRHDGRVHPVPDSAPLR